METKKTSRPNSEDNKSRDKSKQIAKQNSNTAGKGKRILVPNKERSRSGTPPAKLTQLPKLKAEGKKANASPTKSIGFVSSMDREILNEELDEKLRLLEAKEKSIAQYYEKIKKLNGKVLELQKEFLSFDGSKLPRTTASSSTSITLASDAVSFNQKEGTSELFSNFEKNIYQISDIWLRPSLDLSKILTNFKNNASLDSDQFEIENSKIQLAIKQAKSLTLIKTKSAIAEAKKLFNLREGVQSEVDDVDLCKKGNDMDVHQKDETFEETKNEESGDSKKTNYSNCLSPTTKDDDGSLFKSNDGENCPSEVTEAKSIRSHGSYQRLNLELAKKNETIIFLNSKIFEFQKACNQHLLENSQLQYKIAEMNEKNQWNQVLWQQISKLKDRIKIIQQYSRQLEAQKKELELKIGQMNVEVAKVNRLNQLFKKQINMLQTRTREYEKQGNAPKAPPAAQTDVNNPPIDTTNLQEKRRIIEELKNMLVLMRGQETFAQQKISEFETKIEKFKKDRI